MLLRRVEAVRWVAARRSLAVLEGVDLKARARVSLEDTALFGASFLADVRHPTRSKLQDRLSQSRALSP